MHRPLNVTCALLAVGLIAIVGCASGSDDAGVDESALANATIDAGGGTTIALPPSQTSEEEGDAGADSGSTSNPGNTNPGNTNPGNTTSCTPANACGGAVDLGIISGDTGSDIKTAQGTTSQWFKVKVSEDDHGAFGNDLELKADLTSPAGENFDLYLYVGNTATAVECAAANKSSIATTGPDTASTEWGESDITSNGSSDERFVTVEVRHVSGTCSPTAKWTLKLYGNTQ
jgi:hypothetical protein